MVKAAKSNDDKLNTQLLEGLRLAIDGLPRKLQGPPSNPGLFPNGKRGEPLVRRALTEGLLKEVPDPGPSPPGRRTQPATYVCLTEKGRQLVLESDSPARVFSALGKSIEQQGEAISTNVQAALEQVRGWREAAEQLHTNLQTQFTRYQHATRTFKAAMDHHTRKSPSAARETSDIPDTEAIPDGWLADVIKYVTDRKRRDSFSRPTLPEIYEYIKRTRPRLTLGEFHDGLRTLQSQRKIRLIDYTQALSTLPDGQNALYLDREVKYYVDLR